MSAWHGSIEVGHAVATCWHCRAEGLDQPHSLGFWECGCELGDWAKAHTHDSEEAQVEVDIPAIKWTDWSYSHEMNSVWKEALIASGGGREAADQWYVFPGIIPVDRIININGKGVGEVAENIQQ